MTAARDWLYLRIHPEPGGDLDVVVRDVVGGLDALLREPEVTRWFWLRYVDRGGTHLRLRALTTPWSADRIVAATESLLPGGARVRPGFYERELGVYGGPAGTALAEERFQVSSELAAALLAERVDAARRVAMGEELLAAAVTSTLAEADRAGHLRDVAAYWTNAGQPPAALSRSSVGPENPPAAPLTGPLVERWLAGLARPAALAGIAGAPDQRGWLFRLTHLTLNRIGITPAVEGALATRLAVRFGG